MFGTRPEIVDELRQMAGQQAAPSAMLRVLVARTWPAREVGPVDRNLLVQYFCEAFGLEDGQAYPIFGWSPDGDGRLTDADLDVLLTKRMERSYFENSPPRVPAAS
jgi:hypothetical protein